MSLSAVAPVFAALCLGADARADLSLSHSLFSVSGEPPIGLNNDSEAGLALTAGNSQSDSINLKQLSSYRWPDETVELQARYLESSASGVDSAKNWGLHSRYERKLHPGWGAFVGQSLEADVFSGFSQRYGSDSGVRHVLWTNDRTKGAAEFGYEYQLENRTSESPDVRQLVRTFVEASYFWSQQAYTVVSAEALPNIKDSSDWLFNGEISVQARITKHTSLKTAYLVNYTHLPAGPGLKTTDSTVTTTFVASF